MTTRGHQTRVEAFKRFLWGWGLSGTDETTHARLFSRFEVYKQTKPWLQTQMDWTTY